MRNLLPGKYGIGAAVLIAFLTSSPAFSHTGGLQRPVSACIGAYPRIPLEQPCEVVMILAPCRSS